MCVLPHVTYHQCFNSYHEHWAAAQISFHSFSFSRTIAKSGYDRVLVFRHCTLCSVILIIQRKWFRIWAVRNGDLWEILQPCCTPQIAKRESLCVGPKKRIKCERNQMQWQSQPQHRLELRVSIGPSSAGYHTSVQPNKSTLLASNGKVKTMNEEDENDSFTASTGLPPPSKSTWFLGYKSKWQALNTTTCMRHCDMFQPTIDAVIPAV